MARHNAALPPFINRQAACPRRLCCVLSLVLFAACNDAPPPAVQQGTAAEGEQAIQTFQPPAPQGRSDWSWAAEKPKVIQGADIGRKMKGVFSTDRAKPLPSVIVFPVVDERNEVRHDGIGLGYQAQLVATYTPQRRLHGSPRRVFEVFQGAGLAREGARLTPELIDGCLKSLDARAYAVCTLVPAGQDHELRIRIQGDGSAVPDATFSHGIEAGTLSRVPVLVAGDLLRHLKVDLSAKEREWIAAQQLDADEANTLLGGFLTGDIPRGEVVRASGERNDIAIHRFVLQNPRSLAAWEMYVNIEVSEQFFRPFELDPPFAHPLLDLAKSRRVLAFHRPAEALSLLIKNAPILQEDPEFHRLLAWCAVRTKTPQLVEESLAAWRRADSGHSGCILRGRWLLDRGAEAYLLNPAEKENASVRPWLESARTELERAAQLFPGGWEAPTHLISVATGLGLPRAFVDQQFASATQLVPSNHAAYRRTLQYLLARSPGDTDQIFEFAETCAKTGFWSQGIPQLVEEAVAGAGLDLQNHTTDFAVYRSERLWAAVKAYYEGAQQDTWLVDRRRATNTYALYGALCGHQSDVAALLRTLEADTSGEIYDSMAYSSGIQFMHLVDQAMFHGGAGAVRALAGARLALSEGKLDEAERLLQQAEAGAAVEGQGAAAHEVARTIDSTRQAVVYGRRLFSSRSADFSANDLAQIMVSHWLGSNYEKASHGLTGKQTAWRVDGKHLVWTFGISGLPDSVIYFPIGIKHGVISGTIEVSGSIQEASVVLHTRSARDEVWVNYQADKGEADQDQIVTVVRGSDVLMQAPCGSGPWTFRITFGAKEDQVEPVPGAIVLTKVVNDVPSGFAFQAEPHTPTLGTFKLSNLKIELTQE